jgi:hypothetical protein
MNNTTNKGEALLFTAYIHVVVYGRNRSDTRIEPPWERRRPAGS